MFGADTNILVGRFFGWYNIYKGGSHWVGDIPQILGKGWKGKERKGNECKESKAKERKGKGSR